MDPIRLLKGLKVAENGLLDASQSINIVILDFLD
jgi:hypothetical protein